MEEAFAPPVILPPAKNFGPHTPIPLRETHAAQNHLNLSSYDREKSAVFKKIGKFLFSGMMDR